MRSFRNNPFRERYGLRDIGIGTMMIVGCGNVVAGSDLVTVITGSDQGTTGMGIAGFIVPAIGDGGREENHFTEGVHRAARDTLILTEEDLQAEGPDMNGPDTGLRGKEIRSAKVVRVTDLREGGPTPGTSGGLDCSVSVKTAVGICLR